MTEILTSENTSKEGISAIIAGMLDMLDGDLVSEFSGFDDFYTWAQTASHYEGMDADQEVSREVYRAVYDALFEEETGIAPQDAGVIEPQTDLNLLIACERFIAGFEGDGSQEGIEVLLWQVRSSIAKQQQA